MPNVLENVKRYLIQFTELGLLLVALFVVLQILFGESTFLVGPVVTNLLTLIKSLGDSGLVGLIAIGIILWLFQKRAA